jgi:transketolase
LSFTEDVAARFDAMGWHTQRIDGMNLEAVDRAILEAKLETDRPSLILAKTVIGYGSPKLAGTNKAHSNPFGPEELAATKEALGISQEPFHVPSEVRGFYAEAARRGAEKHSNWTQVASATLKSRANGDFGTTWHEQLTGINDKVATRKASEHVINAIANSFPGLLGGSADLAESNLTTQKGLGDFTAKNPSGRTINYGVREHAMVAAVNGINLHGAVRGFGASFMVFSDYARPAIRLAALMECPSIFVFTHDSVGVGEDGPTHEPIEHLTSLRAIPNLNVFRPADGNETVVGWKLALESQTTPTLLALTRQALPPITPDTMKGHPAEKGGYVLKDSSTTPDVILIGSGSEVQHALSAQAALAEEGVQARVVSMPSPFLFDLKSDEYRSEILPKSIPAVAIEAGATLGWYKYAQAVVGIDRFGLSAPGDVVMRELGITAETLVNSAKQLLARI